MEKTRDQIESLKHSWMYDACWDIEETEGFEAHKEELKAFRIVHEERCKNDYKLELQERAVKLGIPDRLDLVKYLEGLEYQIKKLNERIDRLEGN